MKNHKHNEIPPSPKSSASTNSLNKYLDKEVTLIHQDLDELKQFLAEHSAMTTDQTIAADTRRVDEYYHSADDLFRQVALEMGDKTPLEDSMYETYLLKKKLKKDEQGDGKAD